MLVDWQEGPYPHHNFVADGDEIVWPIAGGTMRLLRSLCLMPLVWLAVGRIGAAEPTAEQIEFFESRIRPVLVDRCYDCHSGDAPESELRVDSLAGLLRGGTRGPAILPGDPQHSLLVTAVKHSGQIFMPPKEKIPQSEIAALAEWVKDGAHWPGAEPVAAGHQQSDGGPLFTEEERSYWAFQPPHDQDSPQLADPGWVRNPIDAFILARLESAGLSPAPPADKRTLIRRATFDLIGLPPTPEEVDAFLADDSEDAFAALVERLLASPQYGVRWARHWLDVARYADSNGLDENLAYAHAYRYRDYVVDAFNADKPYDRFVQEQLAGDLLPSDSVDQRIEGIAATGFLCIGAKMLAEDDPVKMQMDIVDEQVDTLGKAFLGMTLGCARCHDHKFDPFPTQDYYSLAGIFKSTKTMENFSVVARWHERPLASEAEIAQQRQQQQAIDDAQAAINRLTSETNESLQAEARRRLADYLLAAEEARRMELALTQLSPVGSDAAASDRDGVVVIEAEDFARGNVRKDFDAYGKGIGVILNDGPLPNFAEYRIAIADPGYYQLELRYAAAEARPCRLTIDGHPIRSDVASQVTGSWNPDTQRWFVEAVHRFEFGKHTIRLERDGPFPHVDRLLIAPVPAEQVAELSKLAGPAGFNRDELDTAFVQQWQAYLGRTGSDLASPFAAWNRFAANEQLPAPVADEDPLLTALFREPQPDTPAKLARRYQEVFEQIEEEHRRRQQTDSSEPSTSAPDDSRRALRDVLYDSQGPFAVPKDVESRYPTGTAQRLSEQRSEHKRLQDAKLTLPAAMAVAEGTPQNVPVHIRGSHVTLGETVPRRFPQILAGVDSAAIGDDRSGRLELARWMTEPDHPLTSRVMVNRLWQWHFGDGLVRTPDNFGRLGERPTHPELLDWLAVRFVESGWSIKAMHRLLMLSSTYQMSTQYDAGAATQDPENRLWWRRNRRRLEAEAIRDAILAASGNLDLTMGGSLLPTENRKYVTSTANVDPVTYQSNRRSLYLPVVRSAVYDVLQAFDFADPSVLSGQRRSTTVAPQA
ncbi:MAG: DUF1549 domain-containing protein, partial [Planctomycetaceae bacterium]